MTELLFIAITIFAAYAVFSVIKAPGAGDESSTSAPETPEPPKVEEPAPAKVQAASKPAASPKPAKPAPAAIASTATAEPAATSKPAAKAKTTKSTTSRKTAAAKASAPAVSEQPAAAATGDSDSLKNPKTGEISKVPGNYAFAKRWIKDALVSEGLLDKVYKNTELDNATQAKIQAAIQQLKALPKYRA